MDNFTGGQNKLEDLATLFLATQAKQPETGPKFITAGNKVMGMDNTGNSGIDRLSTGLNQLATNYLMVQKMQKRNKFFSDVNKIMGSNDGGNPEEKRNALRQLITQHGGEDYGLGIKDVLWKDISQPSGSMVLKKGETPNGMEVVGYDQKGNPMIRKVQPNIAQEKFNVEQNEKALEKEKQTETLRESAQATLSTISELKQGLKYFGAAGDVPPWPAEYSKKNWLANYNRLKDKLVVDLMLKLKSASKTGATGFGQLSEKEGMRLENAATALQKGLNEKDALRYLEEIERGAMKIMGEGGTPNQSQPVPVNIPKYNPKTQKLQINARTGEYRVISR